MYISDITRNRTIKKKNKRVRTAFTTDQIRTLEKTFLKNKYINADNRRELSKQLKIDDKCIKIWFQNKRMKEKREASESSDSLSENARDMVSPPLIQHDPPVDHKADVFYDQYNHQAPYNYYQPQMLYTHNISTQDLANEPPTNGYVETDFSGMVFCNETNPYPTQYYPNDEAGINNLMCQNQNQYQYTNDMYSTTTGAQKILMRTISTSKKGISLVGINTIYSLPINLMLL